MISSSLRVSILILFILSLVEAQLPFGLNAAKIFGYESFSRPLVEVECTTDNKHPGTCMSRKECNQHSGVASGICGNGVCCEISMGCGKVSRAKKTVIRNPSPIPDNCNYYFRPFSKHVCQLRIDFNAKLGAPTVPHVQRDGSYVQCENSYIRLGPYKLCGVNKNQHIYLPFVAEDDQNIEIGFTIVHREAEFAATDYWDIIVTQLECPSSKLNELIGSDWTESKQIHYDTDLIAPDGCLQYYTERNGLVESFNYNNGKGPYLGNMKYAVCFKRAAGDTSILFEADRFNMNVNRPGLLEVDTNCFDPLTLNPHSSKDYLLIPDSYLTTPEGMSPNIKLEGSKYCGSILQDRKLWYSPVGPFAITVNTDDRFRVSHNIQEGGFSIRYTIDGAKSSLH